MLTDRPVHATLPCSDLERAQAFYAEKLGLTAAEVLPGGAFFTTSSGTRFLLYPTSGRPSGEHTQMGWAVDDIVATVGELRGRGVEFMEYDFPGFDKETLVATTGDVRAAWFKDSEGNLLGIVQLPE